MMSSTISEDSNEFILPPDSPGSSVSTQLQEEYDELLKFAVVVPSFDPSALTKTLSDTRGSFQKLVLGQGLDTNGYEGGEEDEDTEVEESRNDEEEERDPVEWNRKHRKEEVHFLSADEPQESTPLDGMSPASSRDARTLPKLATHHMGDPLATKLFIRSEPDSPRSMVSDRESLGSEVNFSVTIDQDISHMETLLDQWTGDLRRNVLAEFGQAKIKLIGYHKQQVQREREKHAGDLQRMHSDIDGLKELLHTYEKSIERKDQVIANLTSGLQKQKEKFEMMRTFSDWKIQHNDHKREILASKLAQNHYHRKIIQKCYDSWHSVVESKWRQRVEKACQAKAQEVCMALTNDYETRLSSLNEALEASRVEVNRLHTERERYEETMKKAFMRGVCALNLEAMSMFQEAEENSPEQTSENIHQADVPISSRNLPTEEFYHTTVPQEPVYNSDPPGAPPPRVVTSQAAARGLVVGAKSITTQARSAVSVKPAKSKVIHAKVTGRGEPRGTGVLGSAGLGLAPPMSSVVVERHQPVTKQTVGHATAARYVRTTDSVTGAGGPTRPVIQQRKITGQSGQISIPNQNIQTVKVVE